MIIALLLLLAFACAAGAAVVSRNSRTPLTVYLKAERNALKDMAGLLKDTYEADFSRRGYDKGKSVFSERYEFKAEANAATLELLKVPEAETVSGVIDKLKIRLDSSADREKNDTVTDLTLYMNDSPVLLGQLYFRDGDIYLGADTLFPDTWFKLGGKATIDTAAKQIAPAEYRSRIDKAFEDIYTFLEETVTRDSVTSHKGDEPATLTVQLDTVKTKQLFEYILKRLTEAKAIEAYDVKLFQYLQLLMPDQLKTEAFGGLGGSLKLSELTEEFMSRTEITEGLSMELRLNSTGDIVDRRISFSLKESGKADTAFNIHLSGGKNGQYLPTKGITEIVTSNRDGSAYRNEISIEADLNLSGEVPQGILDISLKTDRSGTQNEYSAVLEVGSEAAAAGKPAKTKGSLSVSLSSPNEAGAKPYVILSFTRENLPEREFKAPVLEGKKLYIPDEMTEAEKKELGEQLDLAITMFMLSSGALF